MPTIRSIALFAGFVIAASAALPGHTAGQSNSDVCPSSSIATRRWSAPLDKTVTISDRPLPLDQALARVAAAAGIRLSFSNDLLPAGRIGCLSFKRAAAGDVLAFLLRDAGLEIAVAGDDQVVIMRAHTERAAADTAVMQVFPLGRVLATADAQRAAAEKTPSFAVTILDATSSGWHQGASLVDVLNTNVPGMWMWTTAGGGVAASYGSTRGSSSFGVTGPKILIDGIEVANPLLLSRITLDAVDRIEIIRGPQGSARYGADALNGVTNIITRHDTSTTSMPHLQASSALGVAASRYANEGAVTQDHSLRMQIGRTARSFDLDLGLGSIGAYAPGAGTTHANADASMRFIGSKTILTGTFRYVAQSIDTTGSGTALLALPDAGLATAFADASVTEALSLHEYTAGFNASYAHNARWSHSLVAGIDGYNIGGVAFDTLAPANATDAILRDAGSTGLRTTLRANSIARFAATGMDATLTLTGDHTRISQRDDNLPVFELRERPDSDDVAEHMRDSSRMAPPPLEEGATQLRTSTGISAELTSTLREHLSLTGALRLEHDAGGTAGSGRESALPVLGAAYRWVSGDAEIKLRSSYGKGVRWPAMTGLRDHMQIARMTLEPEQQTGFEVGVDFRMARNLSLQITRFDQTATGLAQQVTLQTAEHGRPGEPRFGVEMQNVGAISNKGWELQGSVRHGAFSLAAAGTLLDSRVLRVAAAYTGDLRPGDHPLAVPSRTMSLTASVTRPTWSTSLTTYRAADWVNYDRIAMTAARGDSTTVGLRRFWKTYDGFTHVGVNATRTIRGGLVLVLSGSNLLNRQIGEPDNVTIVPGRTWSAGIRAVF